MHMVKTTTPLTYLDVSEGRSWKRHVDHLHTFTVFTEPSNRISMSQFVFYIHGSTCNILHSQLLKSKHLTNQDTFFQCPGGVRIRDAPLC